MGSNFITLILRGAWIILFFNHFFFQLIKKGRKISDDDNVTSPMSAQKLMKAACKKLIFWMFIAIDYIQKTNIILPFSQPKKNRSEKCTVQYFPPIFYTLLFFFSLYNHSSSYTFFFLLVFLLPFVYCCAFILFSLFLPLVFLVSIFIHFMSPMFHIFFSAL